MHVHIENEDALKHLVANGVTTIRNMWGYKSPFFGGVPTMGATKKW